MAAPRKKDGRWEISAYDEHGTRRWYRGDTRAEVNAWHAMMTAEKARGDVIAPRDTEWGALEERWKLAKRGKRTLGDDLGRIGKWLRPAVGHLQLEQITPDRVSRLDVELEDHGLSVATRRQVLGLLRSMLRLAQRERMLSREVHIVLPQQTEQPYDWIRTRAGIGRLLDIAGTWSSHKIKHQPYPGLRALYATGVFTGMRVGEVCGLRMDSLDLRRGMIEVRRSWGEDHTKSKRIRHVPILDSLRPELDRWLAERSVVYPGAETDHVFLNTLGRPIQKSTPPVDLIWHKVLHAAGEPPMGIHALRHTFASHWVMNGGDIFKLNRILGHSDMKLTMRYAHLAPGAYDRDRGLF
jgi:integrase